MIWGILYLFAAIVILSVKVSLVLWPIIWTCRAFVWLGKMLCHILWRVVRWSLGYRQPPAYVRAMRGVQP